MVLFNDKRVEAVHIRPVAPNAKVDVSLRETIYASESLLVEKLDAEGNVLERRKISSPRRTRAPEPPPSVEWSAAGAERTTNCTADRLTRSRTGHRPA